MMNVITRNVTAIKPTTKQHSADLSAGFQSLVRAFDSDRSLTSSQNLPDGASACARDH